GYALEIFLRGATNSSCAQTALTCLKSAPMPVFEHGAIVLASQGLGRAVDVFRLGSWDWAADQIDALRASPDDVEKFLSTINDIVHDEQADRAFVGLVLAVVTGEHDERAAEILEQSGPRRFHSVSSQLRRMFGRQWLR
ncbi:MAG TPA: hypothetical protein VEQ58_03335, partial [Polyangiaceae bacterium]|nr:hypothetical protein [Polyangiaceae bacterium]